MTEDTRTGHKKTVRNSLQGRQIKEYEGELDIADKEEGIFDTHVLMIIINRLTLLHKRLQVDMIRKSKKTLEQLKRDIAYTYTQIDQIQPGGQEEDELNTVIQFRNIYSQKCTSTGLAPKFEK